ncbi:hypothetical protein ACSHT2_02650 [Bradyrhizobium sp. PUT101]|uniref:hypothetical protein n=1 Tax=Bradyrhizobium sp. PUT101 TaxID=3447427 RepID=UPI003F86CB9D
MNAITRPPVRWHGAKFLMSRQILPHLPTHRLYTEVFGGGAGVLLHKPRSQRHDGERSLHYVDPPYVHETRSMFKGGKSAYKHEMDLAGHNRLLGALRGLRGMVVLSGYAHALYDAALEDWRRIEFKAYADGARERTEVLWINPAASAALDRERAGLGVTPLFTERGAA